MKSIYFKRDLCSLSVYQLYANLFTKTSISCLSDSSSTVLNEPLSLVFNSLCICCHENQHDYCNN